MSRSPDTSRSTRDSAHSIWSNNAVTHQTGIARRHLLGTVGAITLGGTAGCLSWFGDDVEETPSPTPTGTLGFGEGGYGSLGYGGIAE